MSDIKGRCPHCGKVYKVPSEYIGKEIKCPSCKQPVIIEYKAPEPVSQYQQLIKERRCIASNLRFTLCPILFIVCAINFPEGAHPGGVLIGAAIASLILTLLTVEAIELTVRFVVTLIKEGN